MELSQYFIAKSDKYVLVRKIGNRYFQLVSDEEITRIKHLYQKIHSKEYDSEKELFEDIFRLYHNKSIIPLFETKRDYLQ